MRGHLINQIRDRSNAGKSSWDWDIAGTVADVVSCLLEVVVNLLL
jgi:hypothetical protein